MPANRANEIRAVVEALTDTRDHIGEFLLQADLPPGPADAEPSPLDVDFAALSQGIDHLTEYADYVAYSEGEGQS